MAEQTTDAARLSEATDHALMKLIQRENHCEMTGAACRDPAACGCFREKVDCVANEWEQSVQDDKPATQMTRECRFDVLRNSKDLYGSLYYVIAALVAYQNAAEHRSTPSGGLLESDVPGYSQLQDLCRIAGKVAPHLPAPAEDANVWTT